MKTIYLSPSNQTANVYAAGNTNEAVQMNIIAKYTYDAIVRSGSRAIIPEQSKTLTDRIVTANEMNVDSYVSIHSNAGGGHFTAAFYNPNIKGSYELASEIFMNVAELTGTTTKKLYNGTTWQDDGLKEINSPNMPCTLIEVQFHDNVKDAGWIISNSKEIGESIAEGVLSFLKVPYVSEKDTSGFKIGDVVNFKENGKIYPSIDAKIGKIPYYKKNLVIEKIYKQPYAINKFQLSYNKQLIGYTNSNQIVLSETHSGPKNYVVELTNTYTKAEAEQIVKQLNQKGYLAKVVSL